LKEHAKSQLNFQITTFVVALVAIVLSVVTLGVGLVVAIPAVLLYLLVDVICSIRAAMAASRGEDYQFPFSLHFVK